MKRRALALTLTAAATLTACGGGSEKLSEKAIEQAIKENGGSNVDVDVNNGEVKIKTEDGEMTVSGDGKDSINITSDSGSFQAGASAEMPKDFPSEVPVPDLELQSQMTTKSNGDTNFMLTFVTKSPEKDFAKYTEALKADGFDISDEYTGTTDGKFSGRVAGSKGAWEINAFTSEDGDGSGSLVLMATSAS
ncbi:MAG: hypothetical protein AB7V43_15765 [Acidimicrobiia bacterium]